MPTRKNPLYKPRVLARLQIPAINQYGTRSAWEKASWKILVKQLKGINSFSELILVLSVIVSPREMHAIVMRAAGISRLESGASYTKIGKELWLAPQTIAALRRGLQSTHFKSYREVSKTERKKKVFYVEPSSGSSGKRLRRSKYGNFESNF